MQGVVRGVTDKVDSTMLKERNTLVGNKSQEIGKDTFLKLLVSQIKHQDPFDTADPSKFVEQMATFSSLEQMTTLNTNMELLLSIGSGGLINSALQIGTNAIGKYVEVGELDESGNLTKYNGKVKSAFIDEGRVYLEVELDNGEVKDFPYESLLKISEGK